MEVSSRQRLRELAESTPPIIGTLPEKAPEKSNTSAAESSVGKKEETLTDTVSKNHEPHSDATDMSGTLFAYEMRTFF